MDLIVLFGIAIGLAMDAFAVSIAVSVTLGGTSRRQTFRLAWHFGLFQALMPIIGWIAGRSVRPLIESWDHWLAFALLTIVGGRMILEAVRGGDREGRSSDPTRGWSLVVLSIATSIDALAIGLSFAALGVEVWLPVRGNRSDGRRPDADRHPWGKGPGKPIWFPDGDHRGHPLDRHRRLDCLPGHRRDLIDKNRPPRGWGGLHCHQDSGSSSLDDRALAGQAR